MQVNIGVKPATYENGMKVSEVAAINNYGSETIPPRPVFRIAAEKIMSTEEFKDYTATYVHNLLEYELYNKGDLKDIQVKYFSSVGRQIAAECKRIIKGGSELQENAPSTTRIKELKGSKGVNKPLYDTGLLLKNIAHELSED